MIKSLFRNIVFPVAVGLHVDKLIRKLSKSSRLILMYHGVVPSPDFSLSVNHISVDDFHDQIVYLKNNFKIRRLKDLFEDYKNNVPAREFEVAITFDDGYSNNFNYAYPILRQHNIPATIFVVTQALETPGYILWYDFIDGVKSRIDFHKIARVDFGFDFEKTILQKGVFNVETLKSFMKRIGVDEKNKIIQWIKKQEIELDVVGKKDFFELLSPIQIKEITESGLIEIGSHSHNHPNLAEIPASEAEQEIVKSKKMIEDVIGFPVISIAFPDGSYNETVKKLCLQAGYKNLLAVDYKFGTDIHDKSILPRFCISNTTTSESNILNLNRSLWKKGF